MKKLFLVSLLILAGSISFSAELPDNIYFKAMKDEMNRTLKQLREPGSPKINYMTYKMSKYKPLFAFSSSLGSFYPEEKQNSGAIALWVTVSVGDNKQDSLGMSGNYPVSPIRAEDVPESYDGIRQFLWQATSDAYFQALDLYQQKVTYKQQKDVKDDLPDVVPAVQSNYVETIADEPYSFEPARFQDLIQRLTDRGNKYSYIKDFYISVSGNSFSMFYLNNNGGFFQKNYKQLNVEMNISYVTKTGFHKEVSSNFVLPLDAADFEEKLTQQADKLLAEVEQTYKAEKGTSYIGPVLLKPQATAELFVQTFIPSVTNLTPLRSLYREEDTSAGLLQDGIGKPILSKLIDVYDRPQLRVFDGFSMGPISPIDDEGVQAKDLTIIQKGVLTALPTSTRPFAKNVKSNGHARGNRYNEPREALTNVIVDVETGISDKELEDALLQLCREKNLEYCYILSDIPQGKASNRALTRIYAKDGRKEPIDGLFAENLSLHTLRKDVVAGGVTKEVYFFYNPVRTNIIAPSLLLDDMSLQVSKKRPDSPSFIPKP